MATSTTQRVHDGVRKINDRMWESLDNGGRTEPIAFFCECADDCCYRPVWLTPADYERGRLEPHWTALAAEHLVAPAAER